MKPLPRFTAVIHVESDTQAVEQAAIAFGSGAGGVFLIDHARPWHFLFRSYMFVRHKFPDAWLGLNFLDLNPMSAICTAVPDDVDAIWTDGSDATSTFRNQAYKFGQGQTWKLFMGAAFKGQAPDPDPAATAGKVARWGFIPCTSGPATGVPATVEKVRAMKEAIGAHWPLALASGVTIENFQQFGPHVDCFMVATGISKSFHELDAAKVQALANVIQHR